MVRDRSVKTPPDARDPTLRQTVGKYLPDVIFGANDGVVTTLAVVSGVTGAALSPTVVLVLGFANLLADGFSMGASNVLARRSNADVAVQPTIAVSAGHGLATFIGFAIAGLVPLLAYLMPWSEGDKFLAAAAFALITLFLVGAGRALFTGRGWLVSGLEMLSIGALAAGVAYAVGAVGAALLRVS
jgi:VIT1/CCC1 family predicted Fe2+/Mn2+ transporter